MFCRHRWHVWGREVNWERAIATVMTPLVLIVLTVVAADYLSSAAVINTILVCLVCFLFTIIPIGIISDSGASPGMRYRIDENGCAKWFVPTRVDKTCLKCGKTKTALSEKNAPPTDECVDTAYEFYEAHLKSKGL